MELLQKKRERSTNFNSVEIELLLSLVEKNKHIVENKKTDAVTNKDKLYAWKKIENAFNSCGITSTMRSWKTLKLKYDGIKKNTKKKSASHRQHLYQTGGGPSINAPEFSEIEEKVLKICSNIKGLDARHDSDVVKIQTSEVNLLDPFQVTIVDTAEQNVPSTQAEMSKINIQAQEVIEIPIQTQETIKIPESGESLIKDVNEENGEDQKDNKWDRWDPKALRTKVSNVLKTASKTSVSSKLDQLSTARLELVKLQTETAQREQLYIEEKHKLEIKFLENVERIKIESARRDLELKEEKHKYELIYLANEEQRKKELHELHIQKFVRSE